MIDGKGLRITLLVVLAFVLGPISPAATAQGTPRGQGRYYAPTGKTLAAEFVDFYDRYGGVLQFGYPVTEARMEGGYLVQWTERQRLEHHPEFRGTTHEVLLGLLGRELTTGMNGPRFQRENLGNSEFRVPSSEYGDASSAGTQREARGGQTERFFSETGQWVVEPFLSYWRENGGLPVYGYPISSLHRDERGLEVQWFERARFEHHADKPAHPVLLGHLGWESLRTADLAYYELAVHGTPAPDPLLRVELAQGGESDDPGFFDNIAARGRELGGGLLRIDNIYNYYDIVRRGVDGTISYNWDKFDRLLDGIRAMGMEPLICLSYMPETMSLSGTSRVEPPARLGEWAALVAATVRHVNIERGLGVRYWEVWNEPDQISFWRASFAEYLRMYDATVEAALAVDPSIKIGGPATARFSADHFDEFLYHESMRGEAGRVDFLSWHEYGRSPEELGAHIREAREVLAKYPSFQPELFVTEFNVLQGGPGDTSANGNTDRVEGAIALLRSIEGMQRERLDRAFLFELKDGRGAREFWGRWGILTHGGQPKPIYHVLKAFQARPPGMLPVTMRQGHTDGSLGMMAFGGPTRSTMFVWYTGAEQAKMKINLPASFGDAELVVTLFDAQRNNPARTGETLLRPWTQRHAADLVFTVQPNSLMVITTR